jgi:hypothetical protein
MSIVAASIPSFTSSTSIVAASIPCFTSSNWTACALSVGRACNRFARRQNAAAAADGQAPVPDISVSQRPAKGRPPPHGGQVPETAHPPTTHCSKIIPDFMSARGEILLYAAASHGFLSSWPSRKFRLVLRDDQLWKQRDSPSTVACVLPSLSSVRGALDWLKMPELTVSFGGGLTPHRAFLEPRS